MLVIILLSILGILILFGIIMHYQLEETTYTPNYPICDELERCEYCLFADLDAYEDEYCEDYPYLENCPEIYNLCQPQKK